MDSELEHGSDRQGLLPALAHQLRQIAGVVAHQTEIASAEGIDPAIGRRSLTALAANADELTRLTDDLTDLADLEVVMTSPGSPDPREDVDLGRLARAAADSAGPSSVVLVASAGERVPRVHANPAMLRRAVSKLVCETAARADTTTIDVGFDGCCVRLVISASADEPADLSSCRPVRPADGIGVYLAARLGAASGADVSVSSSGTVFVITLSATPTPPLTRGTIG
jgi:signal transduction histidine kinase